MKTNGEEKGQRVPVFSMSENQCVWMKAGVVKGRVVLVLPPSLDHSE